MSQADLVTKNKGKADFNEYLRIIGNDHLSTLEKNNHTKEIVKQSGSIKVDAIAWHFSEIMKTLGLDLNDDSLKGTPSRVAEMFVNEVFSGLDPANKPDITLFENKFGYRQMLVERDIKVHSFCEHHFVPIIGKAHVAYIPGEHVIGLSKLNRIVDYYARRPQVQERLTEQIAAELKDALKTEDVAVMIEADHMCVIMRGVKDEGSSTTTASYHGQFLEKEVRNEFIAGVYRTVH
jgi:GTP cyclohydrolase IA